MKRWNLTGTNSLIGVRTSFADLQDPGVIRSVSPYSEPGFKTTGNKEWDKIRYKMYCMTHYLQRDLF